MTVAAVSATPVPIRRRLTWALLLVALAVQIVIGAVGVVHSKRPNGDFDNYFNIGTRAGRPYVDYMVEFPVATVQTFRTLGPIAGDRWRFGQAMVILSFAANLVILGSVAWGWGLEAAVVYSLTIIPLLDLFLMRADMLSTSLAALGVAAWRRDRGSLAAVALVAGAAFKLWPIAFLPLLLVPSRGRIRLAPVVTAIAAGAAVFGWWLWVAGPSGLYQVLTFRGSRGWEIESTVGAFWMLGDRSTMRVEQGAWRIGTTLAPVTILLFVLGTLPCIWMVWRGARTRHLGAGWAGGISWLLVTSALLSPQFAAWLTPASGIAWADNDRRTTVLTWLAVFFTNLEWKAINPLLHGYPGPMVILLVRNLLLAVLAFDTARLLFRAEVAAPTPRLVPLTSKQAFEQI